MGRRPRAVERAAAWEGVSRVELEHVLARALVIAALTGDPIAAADVVAIRDELAARTWQNINPYAPPDAVGS